MRLLSYIITAAAAVVLPVVALAATPGSVAHGVITLAPGQAVTATIESDGAVATSPDALREDQDRFSGRAVQFELQDMGDIGLMLSIHNGYDQKLVYDADITLASGQHGHTSTCPVMPHISGMESWQDKIVRIDLSNLRLTDSAESACR